MTFFKRHKHHRKPGQHRLEVPRWYEVVAARVRYTFTSDAQ